MSLLLPLLILTPLLGGVGLLAIAARGVEIDRARFVALLISGLLLALSIALVGGLARPSNAESLVSPDLKTDASGTPPLPMGVRAHLHFQPSWLAIQRSAESRLQLSLGADGLGASLALLTAVVTFLAMLFARADIQKHYASYAGWTLLSAAGLMTVFLSMDLVLFYLGFELVLFPVMVLISGWGSEAARAVARRFVLFTLTGSIPMVIALVAIAVRYSPSSGGTILMEELSRQAMLASANETPAGQAWIFWLLVFGFGIKMALLPLHSWLPSVYCESHPTTTALLAGVVLKMGLFGFLRIALPMVPLACNEYAPLLLGASGAIAIVYGAMAALAQTDLRLLLAYGSLSHVGFISLGLFSLTEEGIGGASLQMFNHGLTTAAMFLLVGCIIQRRGSAQVGSIGHGLAQLYPRLAVFFMLFAFAGIGMPGLNNFVGEVLALSGMMAKHPVLSMIGATGIVLGAWYTLRLARDVIFGTAEAKSVEDSTGGNRDLAPREWLAMSALSLVCIALGVWPQPALSFFERDVQRLADIYVAIETSGETSARGISSTRETDLVPGSGEGQRLP